MKEIVFLNGSFIPAQEAKISASAPGFLYGFGLFETMRSYKGRIVYLSRHLERIEDSCKLTGIQFPYTRAELAKAIQETVKINSGDDLRVRLTIAKSASGADILVTAKKYPPPSLKKYRDGFSAEVSGYRQNEGSLLIRLKTTSRFLYEHSRQAAKKHGFDEAVILNSRGYLAEASRSNIFLVKDKELFTPDSACGCLSGVTRQVIFELAKKERIGLTQGNFTLMDLQAADAAFLTNSLMGVMPLSKIENKRIGRGKNKLTHFFMQRYRRMVYGA